MNEARMQNSIYIDCALRRAEIIVPNTTLFGWESDLVAVSAAGVVTEYEIKISRSDFRADFHKLRHALFKGDLPAWNEKGPAYFYYAVPRDMVLPAEVPEYAGLIYVHPVFAIIKKAPKLHKFKLRDGQRAWLTRSIMTKFWRQRLRAEFDAPARDAETVPDSPTSILQPSQE